MFEVSGVGCQVSEGKAVTIKNYMDWKKHWNGKFQSYSGHGR